jgi:hypothetical protein
MPSEVVTDTVNVVVANQSAHADTIGVYVDVMAPAAGGCTPNGLVLEMTVTLAAGAHRRVRREERWRPGPNGRALPHLFFARLSMHRARSSK